jgi:hypothetical protein
MELKRHHDFGFSREYESDNPVVMEFFQDAEYGLLDRICRVAGLVLVDDDGLSVVIGRASMVEIISEDLNSDPAAVERGFNADWKSVRSKASQDALVAVRERITNPVKLRHTVAVNFPDLVEPVGGGNFRLKNNFKKVRLGGCTI